MNLIFYLKMNSEEKEINTLVLNRKIDKKNTLTSSSTLIREENKFNVHKNDGDFSSGLRGFFKYRDLGIADATEGKVNAHVIKAVSGHEKMVLDCIFII